jgi:hypothetical protein
MTTFTPDQRDMRRKVNIPDRVRTGTWDPMTTKLSVLWNELKNKSYYKMVLPHWYEELNRQYSQSNALPVVLNATTMGSWVLHSGQELVENTNISISFWQGIYEKWEKCPRKPATLDPTRPVLIEVYKGGRKQWIINKVEQI